MNKKRRSEIISDALQCDEDRLEATKEMAEALKGHLKKGLERGSLTRRAFHGNPQQDKDEEK